MKIGLLPLYIQLYDETSPEARPRLESFYEEIIRLVFVMYFFVFLQRK